MAPALAPRKVAVILYSLCFNSLFQYFLIVFFCAGYYCVGTVESPCSSASQNACPAGYFSPAGASSCSACPGGYFSNTQGMGSCVCASAGYYAGNSSAATRQLACPAGKYSSGGFYSICHKLTFYLLHALILFYYLAYRRMFGILSCQHGGLFWTRCSDFCVLSAVRCWSIFCRWCQRLLQSECGLLWPRRRYGRMPCRLPRGDLFERRGRSLVYSRHWWLLWNL